MSLPPACLFLSSRELAEFAKSLVAVSTFSANFLFWSKTGYFDGAAELQPLLHTWSLAVEEQYYLFAPLVMAAVWRWRRAAMLPVLAILGAISFGLAQIGSTHYPEATFFLPHTRVWELMVGAVATLAAQRWNLGSGSWPALVGLALILAPVALYDAETPFPGAYALVPTIGTALVLLYARPWTAAGRFLRLSPVVHVGLISYSAYLWHQPLFAFARLLSPGPPSQLLMLALAVAAFALGDLSWRFVERPFRDRRWLSRATIFKASAAGLIGFVAIGLVLQQKPVANARPGLSSVSFAELDAKMAINTGLDARCHQLPPGPACKTGESPRMLLWGDSYAMHLAQALEASPTHIPFVQVTKSSCAPILGVSLYRRRMRADGPAECMGHNEEVMRWLQQQPGIETVVIASIFNHLSDDTPLVLADGTVAATGGPSGRRQLEETLDRIRSMGKTPILVSPTPKSRLDIGRCLTRRTILGKDLDACDFPLVGQAGAAITSTLAQIAERKSVRIISLSALICRDGVCRAHAGDIMIYRDDGHLSREGSAYLGRTHDLAGIIGVAEGLK